MISTAIGAAADPPYWPFSTRTANANYLPPPWNGAYRMNHAWDGFFSSSAVPVLPAIGILVPAAERPVPFVTTARMYPPMVAASWGFMIGCGWSTLGLVSSMI